MRPPRCPAGAGGLLPRYCAGQALGAGLLHTLNRNDYAERFLAYRCIREHPHDIRALLSDSYLRIFTCKHQPPQVVMETHLRYVLTYELSDIRTLELQKLMREGFLLPVLLSSK